MKITGKAVKYGDNIDTDVIIPARYLNTPDPQELAVHCLEDLDPRFSEKMAAGDLILAGSNFGCGSSREHAPLALKAAGVACVIAAGFARIFFRNAINIGLPIVECPRAVAEADEFDQFTVDFAQGEVRNLTKGRAYGFQPFPEFIQSIISAGGLLQAVQQGLFANEENL